MFSGGALPDGLPDFVYEAPAELAQATYTDQIKPRKKPRKQAFVEQLNRDAEPDLADMQAEEAASQQPELGEQKQTVPSKSSAPKAALKSKKKRKAVEVAAEAAEIAAPAQQASPVDFAVLTDDDEVTKMMVMDLAELQGKYQTMVADDWCNVNNVYSSAYRKATKAGLTKNQAQLRGRVSTTIFRKENARVYVAKLAGPFTKPNKKKKVHAENQPADIPANQDVSDARENEPADIPANMDANGARDEQ